MGIWDRDGDVSCGSLLRSYSMGIDLGTTYSCVGIFKDGEAKFNAFSSDVWHREPLCFLDLFGTVGSISLQAVFQCLFFFGANP